jgi:hypothetical protein
VKSYTTSTLIIEPGAIRKGPEFASKPKLQRFTVPQRWLAGKFVAGIFFGIDHVLDTVPAINIPAQTQERNR